jgi:hypothetical protein
MKRRDILKTALAVIATSLVCHGSTTENHPARKPSGYSADDLLVVERRFFGHSDQAELDEILATPHVILEDCFFHDVVFTREWDKPGVQSTCIHRCVFNTPTKFNILVA